MKTLPPFASIAIAVVFAFLSGHAGGQLISYEPFTGMTVGSGVTGSGTGATGWTDSGWNGGTDSRFQTVAPLPSLTYQISGGAYLDGGNRGLQLTTAPEPVPNGLLAYRQFSPQNTTLFASFLFRPVTIGTGTDSIELPFSDGITTYGRLTIRPDQSGTFFPPGVANASGSLASGQCYTGQTYLFVGQFARTSSTSYKLSFWINPPATFPGNGSAVQGSLPSTATVSQVGFSISSTDTGGPTSTVNVDELRVGYTWPDVVPPAPVQLVPTVTIGSAVELSWQTQSGNTYQPQYSYDMTNWFNLGSSISGNGQMKNLFDSTDSTAKKFYRIQIQ